MRWLHHIAAWFAASAEVRPHRQWTTAESQRYADRLLAKVHADPAALARYNQLTRLLSRPYVMPNIRTGSIMVGNRIWDDDTWAKTMRAAQPGDVIRFTSSTPERLIPASEAKAMLAGRRFTSSSQDDIRDVLRKAWATRPTRQNPRDV